MSKKFKIYNVVISGLNEAILASRYPMITNPLEYIEEGDYKTDNEAFYDTDAIYEDVERQTGKACDLSAAANKTGLPHDCYLKGVTVSFDVDYPIYWEVQRARYHFIDIVSSSSTMHRLANSDIKENCNEYVDEVIIARCQELQKEYNQNKTKEAFNRLVASLPRGYMLSERLTTNYLQLKNIYKQRNNHRLPEWGYFCKWVESLPMMDKLLTL